jgi:hypothetical protein
MLATAPRVREGMSLRSSRIGSIDYFGFEEFKARLVVALRSGQWQVRSRLREPF